MKNTKNYLCLFSFRQNFGNIRWTKLVIDLLEKEGITGITDSMVYTANKVDGQLRYRDEIRAAMEVVYNQLSKEKAARVSSIKARNLQPA